MKNKKEKPRREIKPIYASEEAEKYTTNWDKPEWFTKIEYYVSKINSFSKKNRLLFYSEFDFDENDNLLEKLIDLKMKSDNKKLSEIFIFINKKTKKESEKT